MTAQKRLTVRPRRSVLYMPGANQRALDKARDLPADTLIFDLEDAVAPAAKDQARMQVAAAIKAGGYEPRELVVRINALDTPWGVDDLAACCEARPDAVLLPKISCAADMDSVCAALPENVDLWVMIETPGAIFNLAQIAAAAATTPLTCLVMGTNDLLKDMRAQPMVDRANLQSALALCVLAARQNDLVVLDGVFNAIEDPDRFVAECLQGRQFGFDGKTLIHPNQLGAANDIFAPSPDEIADAQAIVDAFAATENAGQGVLRVNGKMAERLHAEIARDVLTMAAAIAERESA